MTQLRLKNFATFDFPDFVLGYKSIKSIFVF